MYHLKGLPETACFFRTIWFEFSIYISMFEANCFNHLNGTCQQTFLKMKLILGAGLGNG